MPVDREPNLSQQGEKPIASPCVSICVLNQDDVCTGCYRSADEIRLWGVMSNEEKRETLAKSHMREKQVNPFL